MVSFGISFQSESQEMLVPSSCKLWPVKIYVKLIYIEENRITYTINNSRTTEPILLKICEEVA